MAIGSGLLALAACVTDYQQGADDPPYGPPSAARRPDRNEETGDASAPPTQCADAGTCSVTFRSIVEAFRTAQCSATSSCHGGATEPRINPDDATATYNELAKYVIPSTGKPYIAPCKTDANESSIVCNLSASSCGVAMPQGAPGSFDPAKLNDIKTWIQCGAPNN